MLLHCILFSLKDNFKFLLVVLPLLKCTSGIKKHLIIFTLASILLCSLQGMATPQISVIDSINSLGRDHIYSNINKSIALYEQTRDDAESIGYFSGQAKAMQNLGIALYLKGKHDESVAAYLQAIRIYESLDMFEDIALAYGDLGYQMKRRDLPKSKTFMQQGIHIAEKHEFEKILCSLYDNFGVLQEMSSAIDSAQFYYQKALDLKIALKDTIGIPYSLNNLAGIFTTNGDFTRAAQLMKRSDEFRKHEAGNYGRIINTVQWGDFFLKKGSLDSAIQQYQKAIKMPGVFEQSYLASYCFNQIANIYEQKKDFYNAYINHKNFSAFKDSLVNTQTNTRIAELEIEFEAEKKDRLIAENRLEIMEQNEQLAILGIALLLLLIASFGVWKYQNLKNERIRSELALKTKLKQVEYEQKISDEKLRISRDLHDNIGSQLTLLISSTDNLSYVDDVSTVQNKLVELSDFGRATLGDLRNTVWAMKHENGSIDALILKLNEIRQRLSNSKHSLEIVNEVNVETRLSSSQMYNLYRIAQEGLQNAVKHSGANKIQLKFSIKSGDVLMLISDNGTGFNTANGSAGNGLQNMQQRCEEIGGSLEIRSDENGTAIHCTIPV